MKSSRKTKPAPPDAAAAIVVSRRGAGRIRQGHPWVYRSDIESADGVAPGAMAAVRDPEGRLLGTALYSSASQIAVRMFSERTLAAQDFLPLIRERLAEATGFRRRVVQDSDACRVVFSEADRLPGLIVDRYNDVLVLQILTQGMDPDPVRAAVLEELLAHYSPAGVVERVDERIRELEQMPARASGLLHGDKAATVFTMNGINFHFDALAGQKTGAFLDQRENYAAAAHFARGEALDVFCYQGGFALHLARTCERVTGVDSSRAALEKAEQNASLNGRELDWIEGNAFDLLKDYATAGRQYDTIVLDPPAFAKSKRAVETALRGYKELNLRALKMLNSQGLLVTCSCSFHVSEADFLEMLTDAARDARRPLRILEVRAQAKDHPVLAGVPETHYLKCVLAIAE